MRCHGWEAIDPHRDARRLRPIVLRSHAAIQLAQAAGAARQEVSDPGSGRNVFFLVV